jgi:hypothetical protein
MAAGRMNGHVLGTATVCIGEELRAVIDEGGDPEIYNRERGNVRPVDEISAPARGAVRRSPARKIDTSSRPVVFPP